jgi:hypothetical protein
MPRYVFCPREKKIFCTFRIRGTYCYVLISMREKEREREREQERDRKRENESENESKRQKETKVRVISYMLFCRILNRPVNRYVLMGPRPFLRQN